MLKDKLIINVITNKIRFISTMRMLFKMAAYNVLVIVFYIITVTGKYYFYLHYKHNF